LRRQAVGWAQRAYRLSQRREIRALGVPRSSVRYRSLRPRREPLRARIREIAATRVSWGYRPLHTLLRREGWKVNHKLVQRLSRKEGLSLRRKKPERRRAAVERAEAAPSMVRRINTMTPPIGTLHIEAAEDGTFGGSYRSLIDLVVGLPDRGVEPTVLFYSGNPLIAELQEAGVEVIAWEAVRQKERIIRHTAGRMRRYADALAAVSRRRRLLASRPVDILHLNNSPLTGFDDWLPAALSLGIPCVASKRDLWSAAPGSLAGRASRLYSRVIPVSHHVATDALIASLPRDRVNLIYDGVDLSRIPPPEARAGRRAVLRRALGISEHDFLAVMAGTIRWWKGQVQVVHAVAGLPETLRRHMKLLLVGGWGEEDEAYLDEVRTTIEEHGLSNEVFLLGHRADVLDLFCAADVAIHASVRPEPFGLVLVEAMGTGTPVLAANTGGPVEILAEGGGFLHDPGDPADLAGHLERLMTDPELLQGKTQEAEAAASRFCIERTRDGMAAMYREVLAQR